MTPVLAQAYALRAQMDALVMMLEASEGIPQMSQPGICPDCGAGEDKQIEKATLDGTRRRRCSACGREW